jgi:hypothetical protein
MSGFQISLLIHALCALAAGFLCANFHWRLAVSGPRLRFAWKRGVMKSHTSFPGK